MNIISKNTGLSFGYILAAYYILVNSAVFFSDFTWFAKPHLGIANMVVVLILGVSCVWITKRKLGNSITTKEGFSAFFIMIIIGLFVNYFVQFILFNYVNPEAKAINNQLMIDMAENIAREINAPKEEIAEQIELMKNSANDNFTIKTLIFSLTQSVLGASIAGLLISLIFKNKSEFTTPNAQ
ncbi:MAG TPA: DUF4199 domain-containing protein [Flavobacterium sp.]|nr:DUF4199 domain-containing protein [Flavobacterium sp.]